MATPKKVATVAATAKVSEIEIKIEKGVPIPAVAQGRSKYPFEALEIGDSFLVPVVGEEAQKKMRANLLSSARRITGRTGAQFIVLVRNDEKGVRVWRTVDKDAKAQAAKANDASVLFDGEVSGD